MGDWRQLGGPILYKAQCYLLLICITIGHRVVCIEDKQGSALVLPGNRLFSCLQNLSQSYHAHGHLESHRTEKPTCGSRAGGLAV